MSKSIEINLETLDDRARERWADNWNFRAYLRSHEDPGHVDQMVHRVSAAVSRAIDCTLCGNCCAKLQPHLTREDLAGVAAASGISESELTARYFPVDEHGEFVLAAPPCPFLRGRSCSVYESRPDDCRSFPHLHHPDFLKYSDSVLESSGICPIVFNTLEHMKSEFAYDPGVDYIGISAPNCNGDSGGQVPQE